MLLEGRNKEVAGSTYRELRKVMRSIVENGYFDWKPPAEVEPEPKQPEITPSAEVPIVPETVNCLIRDMVSQFLVLIPLCAKM